MFNDIHVGPLTLHMYGLMMGLGFLSALWLCLKRRKKFGLDEDIIWGIFYCAIIGGLLGSKILFIIVELPNILKNPSILADFRNGWVVYGGILGGIFSAWFYCTKIKKVRFLKYFDLVMPAVSLAQGLGRIGCFCAGCCYGRETDLPIGVVFTHSDFAPNGVKLLPTQLFSAGADVILCLILVAYASKKPKDGRVASAWMIFYGLGRFALEFLRNDYRGSIGFLSTSQIISIGIVAVGVLLYVLVGKMAAKADACSDEAVAAEGDASVDEGSEAAEE